MSADDSGPPGSWLAILEVPAFFPSGVIVRIISGIFITLGLAFLAPIVSLIAFDICLWLWRLYSLSRNAFLRRQRLIREEQRERRQLLQQQLQKQKLQKLQSLQKQREAQLKAAPASTSASATETVSDTATATTSATPSETATRRL